MNRTFQVRLRQLWHQRQDGGQKSLHVASSAAMEQAVAFGHPKGIGRPTLPVNRNRIGVAGENDAPCCARADRRPQIGFALVLVRDEKRLDPVLSQNGGDILEQRKIGQPARRVERDQIAEDCRCSRWGRHHKPEPPPPGRKGGGVISMSVTAFGKLPSGSSLDGIPSTKGSN